MPISKEVVADRQVIVHLGPGNKRTLIQGTCVQEGGLDSGDGAWVVQDKFGQQFHILDYVYVELLPVVV